MTIDRHPAVARMLDEQEALAIGGRALCHAARVALEAGDDPDLVEFLTPVCKVFCTEAGIRAADLGIQVLGGYGYLREYRVEQTLRDARITSIYEGTNGIHALTLAGRLLRLNGGRAADAFERFVERQIEGDEQASDGLRLWREARQAILGMENPAEAAAAFMDLTGLVAWQAVWTRLGRQSGSFGEPLRLQRLARGTGSHDAAPRSDRRSAGAGRAKTVTEISSALRRMLPAPRAQRHIERAPTLSP